MNADAGMDAGAKRSVGGDAAATGGSAGAGAKSGTAGDAALGGRSMDGAAGLGDASLREEADAARRPADAAVDAATADAGPPKAPLGGVVAISGGLDQTCALLSDGTLDCWGEPDVGQLGLGAAVANARVLQTTPVMVPGVNGVRRIVAGESATCAVLGTGALECWGFGFFGSALIDYTSPQIVPNVSHVIDVGIGDSQNCAVVSTGNVECFDAHADPNTNMWNSVPKMVAGIAGAKAIASGADHDCVLLSDTSVLCWGDNSAGQLGDGLMDAGPRGPVTVKGLTGVTAIAASWQHSCALLASGKVNCWGSNIKGALGNDIVPLVTYMPLEVFGVQNAVAIATGYYFGCALLAGGTVSCWGDNGAGQLGNDQSTQPALGGGPGAPVTGVTGATAIAAGAGHACALQANGSVVCWGANEYGQLGDGTTTMRTTPVLVR